MPCVGAIRVGGAIKHIPLWRSEELQKIKESKEPKFLHVITKKGKGLTQAERDQITYHAPGQFDKFSGELIKGDDRMLPPKFQDVFGKTLVELAEKNDKIIGITPAKPTGSSMKFMLEQQSPPHFKALW